MLDLRSQLREFLGLRQKPVFHTGRLAVPGDIFFIVCDQRGYPFDQFPAFVQQRLERQGRLRWSCHRYFRLLLPLPVKILPFILVENDLLVRCRVLDHHRFAGFT
ncbi:hypothetical protein D3C78_1551980 [compost metagenome]